MNTPSAVSFETPERIHIALMVQDVARSTDFYRILFGMAPTKVKDDYVKFEVVSPPVNLTLNQVAEPVPLHPSMHFGIQVKSTDAVLSAIKRYEGEGLSTQVEDQTTCCYAVQDKVWVSDPDGHPWEIFVVTDAHSDVHSLPNEGAPVTAEACCTPEAKSSAESAPAKTEARCCT